MFLAREEELRISLFFEFFSFLILFLIRDLHIKQCKEREKELRISLLFTLFLRGKFSIY